MMCIQRSIGVFVAALVAGCNLVYPNEGPERTGIDASLDASRDDAPWIDRFAPREIRVIDQGSGSDLPYSTPIDDAGIDVAVDD
jgi:hypothetical protein